MSVPLIYNIFPRHYATIHDWKGAVRHAAGMGFNWIYLNPVHETGFSGSLYAVKDYFRLNPLFLEPGGDPGNWEPVRAFVAACGQAGLRVMSDLVINHTAFDSPLVEQHPHWYHRDEKGGPRHPFCIDPSNAKKKTVWGDLAEIDNAASSDRDALWAYWDHLVAFLQEMDIAAFRCDAAYQVPAELWAMLIGRAKQRRPETIFAAETLGCRLEEIQALAGCGFDYLYNSSKYWNYDDPWCLEQHESNRAIAPSISFAESHDTPRLASEPPGTIEAQKARYILSAVFSEGVLMPQEFEYGATVRMDVVRGAPQDRRAPQWDISSWIAGVNALKLRIPVLAEEGSWRALNEFTGDMLVMEKRSTRGEKPVLFAVNKTENPVEADKALIPDEYTRVLRMMDDTPGEGEMREEGRGITLGPGECVVVGERS